MPTVFIEDGFRFMIHTGDHPPAHCHVYKAGNMAQVNITPVGLRKDKGFKPRETRRILSIARRRQAELLAAWNELYG